MNKSDELWFFIGKAISYGSDRSRRFFFDKVNNKLFSLKYENGAFIPCFKNENWSSSEDIKKYLYSMASMFEDGFDSKKIVEIPRVSFVEKREVLDKFIDEMDDFDLKKRLIDSLGSSNENDEFDFKYNLRDSNFKLYAKFDMERGRFIAIRTKEVMNFMGIMESTSIAW
jgi:nuclear transport factor 2 (NTF2) superfamily protein